MSRTGMDSAAGRRAAGAGTGVALLTAGFVLGHATGSGTDTTAPPVPGQAPNPQLPPSAVNTGVFAGPSQITGGVPVGYPRTAAGARAAAANYDAALGSPLVLTAAGRDAIVTAIAAPGAATALRANLAGASSSSLISGLAQDATSKLPFAFQTAPLAIRIDGAYGPVSVSVVVYAASYAAGSETSAAAGYGQARFGLAWAGGDWKLTSYTSVPQIGPVPVGYYAPSNGWQPANGQDLGTVSDNVRSILSAGTVPVYAVR